jgi:hypothetical protein
VGPPEAQLLVVVAEANDSCQLERAQKSRRQRARVGRNSERVAVSKSQLREAAKELRQQVVADFRS